MLRSKSTGFSLIELLITVAVLLVLVGFGVPSFISAIKDSRVDSIISRTIGSLYLARSEAVKRSSSVTVCARATDTSCGSDWNNGWIVFVDNTQGGAAGTAGQLDANDEVLQTTEPLDKTDLSVTGSLAQDASSASNSETRDFIRYRPSGRNSWSGGTFALCDDRGVEHARVLHLVLTGDIRKGRTKNDETPEDVHGTAIVCPTL